MGSRREGKEGVVVVVVTGNKSQSKTTLENVKKVVIFEETWCQQQQQQTDYQQPHTLAAKHGITKRPRSKRKGLTTYKSAFIQREMRGRKMKTRHFIWNCASSFYTLAIYTIALARPAFSSAVAGCRPVHLHPLCGPDLKQTLDLSLLKTRWR